tara:strand:+ start:910 stop:1731 length:822 start_codon:yes stop_codon:yes gene_type:complete
LKENLEGNRSLETGTQSEGYPAFHLAGVIPVSGEMDTRDRFLHPTLRPIADNYFPIQHAVINCVNAGCDTIWIVCRQQMVNILKEILGESIMDTRSLNDKRVPIYYIYTRLLDIPRKDFDSWLILHGAVAAFKTAIGISKWFIPNKYYVSLPSGVYDISKLSGLRTTIKSKYNNFLLKSNEISALDGAPLAFSFGVEDFVRARRRINKEGLTTLADAFQDLAEQNFNSIEIGESFDIGTWEGYKCYFRSPLSDKIFRPTKEVIHHFRWKRVAI